MDRGSGVYYYIYDGLGSTRQLVNTGGTVTDTWGYSAFGELASHTGSTVNSFLFNAQQFDQPAGTYFLRARYYDQSNGRFLSQDPFGWNDEDPISLHRYLYANNDAVNNTDPSGNETLVGLSISSSIASSFANIKNSVDLSIYDTVQNGAVFGTETALKIGVAQAVLGIATVVGGQVIRGLWQRYLSSAATEAVEEGAPLLLESQGTGTVLRNKLDSTEVGFAQEIVDFRGGDFVGPPTGNFAGIDGWLDAGKNLPAQLKVFTGGSPQAVARYASQAEAKALKAGYTNVEVFISAKQLSANDVINYSPLRGSGNPLSQIPSQGVVKTINVLTKDGWVRFVGSP